MFYFAYSIGMGYLAMFCGGIIFIDAIDPNNNPLWLVLLVTYMLNFYMLFLGIWNLDNLKESRGFPFNVLLLLNIPVVIYSACTHKDHIVMDLYTLYLLLTTIGYISIVATIFQKPSPAVVA